MSAHRRLQENIAALTVVQLLSYAAPLLTVPYLVRVLQPAQFGLLSFAQGVVLYFDLLTDYGFNFSATRAVAANRHMPASLSRIFWSTIYAKTILMFASAVALTLLVIAVPKFSATPRVYVVSFLYVIGTAFFPTWLFQGLEQMKTAAIAFAAARLLTIPALFLWVRHEQDYVTAAAIQASVQVTATILVAPWLWKSTTVGWYRPTRQDIAETFKQGWPLFLSGSALYVSSSSTAVLLGLVSGRAEVGYFSAADKLIKAVTSLLSPVSQALYPHIAATKAASPFSALQLIRKSFVSLGLLSAAASLSAFVLARPLCGLLLGPSFSNSVNVLRWLSPLPLLIGLMSVFGTQTMLVFEMDAMISRIMLISAAAGIPLTLGLSLGFGARGAAAASVAISTFMVGAMVKSLQRRGLTVWQAHSSQISAAVEA
jgi:polysaccharide transporter, PST family